MLRSVRTNQRLFQVFIVPPRFVNHPFVTSLVCSCSGSLLYSVWLLSAKMADSSIMGDAGGVSEVDVEKSEDGNSLSELSLSGDISCSFTPVCERFILPS